MLSLKSLIKKSVDLVGCSLLAISTVHAEPKILCLTLNKGQIPRRIGCSIPF
jgi:hypothetical protein